jgi:hypothetical protein
VTREGEGDSLLRVSLGFCGGWGKAVVGRSRKSPRGMSAF